MISKKCENNLIQKKVPRGKIQLINNWVDLNTVKQVKKKDNNLYRELGISKSKFLVVYAGNMGETQGTDVILQAAKILEYNSDIQFILFGSGSRYESLRQQSQTGENIRIFPLLPQEKTSEVYSLGDVCLITCKAGTGNAGLPSKLWSIMACNTYVIASFDTDSDLRGILNIANGESEVRVFNLGSGKGISVNDVIDAIRATVRTDLIVSHISARATDVPVNYLDIGRYEMLYGKLNPLDLKEGIRKTAKFLLNNYI